MLSSPNPIKMQYPVLLFIFFSFFIPRFLQQSSTFFRVGLRPVKRPETSCNQTSLAVFAVKGCAPVKETTQRLLLAKRRLDSDSVRVVVAHKPAVTADALRRHNTLVDVFASCWAGEVAVFKGKGAVGRVLGDADKLVTGAGCVGANKGTSEQRDAEQNLLCWHTIGHQILDGGGAGRFIFTNGIKLCMVSTPRRPGSVKVVGGEVNQIDTVGDLLEVKEGEFVDASR